MFVNPLAGSGRAGRHLLQARRAFEVKKFPAEFVLTSTASDLELRARAAIAEGCRFLLAMGGDGTLQGLVNAAYGSGVVLGVLPAGGGNDFAAALGLPKDPVAAVHATLNGQPREVDLLRARTSDGCERLYVGGGGVGLDVDASVYAAGIYRRLPGRLRYVASAVRAWLEFTQLNVQAEFPRSDETQIIRSTSDNDARERAAGRGPECAELRSGVACGARSADRRWLAEFVVCEELGHAGSASTTAAAFNWRDFAGCIFETEASAKSAAADRPTMLFPRRRRNSRPRASGN